MGDLLEFFINACAQLLNILGGQAVFAGATILGFMLAFMVVGVIVRSFVLKGR